ncbi:F17e-G fimbrial adhesin precursor [Caballeronia terrestris]|uniref:F17e-G fimbrial adhesin n=1 Tax=Caballeronia terrestris TaxID=1226301 RepID=A0A158K0F1_9BURK|nr:hypothetical protein [Caballeronia terrestris]SAL73930.1 F17e-G fimbrial adhesin precursor [Caballeronia terrestris]
MQILNRVNALSFGPDSALAATKNHWVVSASTAAGVLDISLIARYIKSSSTIAPGNFKALATFAASYQ